MWSMAYTGNIQNHQQCFACIYAVVIVIFSLWPPGRPVDARNLNYFVLLTGAVAMFSVVYYVSYVGKERVQRTSDRGDLKRSESLVTKVLKAII